MNDNKTIYNCLVVDDEPIARKIVKNYIEEVEFLTFFNEANNAIEALQMINSNSEIDIVFLDINMPSLSGIKMIQMLERQPQIIFTTAYHEYAVESYELNATDYLLKPFSFDRFVKAVLKSKNNIEKKSETANSIVQIKSEGKLFYIDSNDILFCEAMRNYTRIFLKNGTKLMPLLSLSKFESTIIQDNSNFIRVHRSFIVSKKYIDATKGNLILISNYKVPIGIQYKDDFFKNFP
jgi:DNA-binding LytR/AlgR family response regulator